MQGNKARVETTRDLHKPRPHRQRTEPKVWIAAFFLTLLFHGAMILSILVSRPFAPTIVEAKYPDPIELVFASPADAPADKNEPSFFSELPPDRADEPPQSPDFLSNVDSRARDLVPDGEENTMPRLEGQSEAPHIRIDQAIQPPVEPEPEIVEQNPEEVTPEAVPSETMESDAQSPSAQAKPIPELTKADGRPEGSISDQRKTPTPRLLPPTPGLDFFQEEMNRPGGNTALSGIVSINTLAWDYAPWLQQFRRDFLRSWAAPVAYYMGIIDGWTLVELEIAPSGELLRLEKIDEEGHNSLHQCSVDVFKALAPYHPLPNSFPEESLVLRIKLVYPPTRRR